MSATRLILGDCLSVLPTLEPGSVDAVITDPPYGTTECQWDYKISLEPLWQELRRLLQPQGAVVMMAAQPFTSVLVLSNPRWFKYCLVWDRGRGIGCNAPRRPIPVHEDICVFSPAAAGNGARQSMVYNPQGCQSISRLWERHDGGPMDHHRPGRKKTWRSRLQTRSGYPTSILHIPHKHSTTRRDHPTQKPLALMEYLVRTYTNEGSTVLDPFMGSGTTGVACQALGRDFVGIEMDEQYYAIAQRRLSEAQGPLFAGTATNGSDSPPPSAPSQGTLFPEGE